MDNLQAQVDKLLDTNGKLCAEINRQELLIRKLEDLIMDMERDCPSCQYDRFNESCGIKQRISALVVKHD